jgi:hypothetical protein
VIAKSTVLSTAEFDVLWQELAVGEPPTVVGMHPRRRHDPDEILAELDRRELDTERLSRRLEVIARASMSVELRGWDGGELRAVVGRAGQRGTLLVLRGSTLQVSAAPVTGLAKHLVDVLPARKAGPGHSVTVPTAIWAKAVESGGDDPHAMRTELVRGGLRTDDARTLIEMVARCDRFWQFDAAVRTRDGASRRAPRVLTVRGDATNTYLLTRRITDDSDNLTLAPADTAKIQTSVTQLVDGLLHGRA